MQKTTDNLNELFDIVDESDNVVGRATRREVHGNINLIHRSVGILIFNQKNELFLQQRSKTKDTDPFKWTISASGHVMVGDSYEITAVRELEEELGVKISVKQIAKYLCKAPNETEMVMLFQAFSEGPFSIHPQEIEGGKFFTQAKLKSAIFSGTIELSYSGRIALEKYGWVKS